MSIVGRIAVLSFSFAAVAMETNPAAAYLAYVSNE